MHTDDTHGLSQRWNNSAVSPPIALSWSGTKAFPLTVPGYTKLLDFPHVKKIHFFVDHSIRRKPYRNTRKREPKKKVLFLQRCLNDITTIKKIKRVKKRIETAGKEGRGGKGGMRKSACYSMGRCQPGHLAHGRPTGGYWSHGLADRLGCLGWLLSFAFSGAWRLREGNKGWVGL